MSKEKKQSSGRKSSAKTRASANSSSQKSKSSGKEKAVGGVPLEAWRTLYEAAVRFRDAKPWSWMYENYIVAIRHPSEEDTLYLSIMGHLGEHFSLAIYRGNHAFFQHLEVAEITEYSQNSDIFMLFEISSLQASFEDRDLLAKEDRAVIDQLGMKFRGRGQWPLFRSYEAGYIQWFLDHREVQLLTWGLEQGLDAALLFKKQPALISTLERENCILLREAQEQDGLWHWNERKISPEYEPFQLAVDMDSEILSALKMASRRKIQVEIDFCPMPISFREDRGGRPRRPYMWMAVDSTHAMVIAFEIVTIQGSWESTISKLPLHILSQIASHLGGLPSNIRVSSQRMNVLLSPCCQQLQIKLEVVSSLPALENARNHLFYRM